MKKELTKALKIAKKFNFSDDLLELFEQYLKQSSSVIKMFYKNGFYQSNMSTTGCDGQEVFFSPRSRPDKKCLFFFSNQQPKW